MDRSDARRLALALRDELWSSASTELRERPADHVGLNPPEDVEDEELAELVWRAVRTAGLAGDA